MSVADAYARRARLAEPVRRVGEADARREVVQVRIVDARAPVDEGGEAGDERELRGVESVLDAVVNFVDGRVVLEAKAQREREVLSRAPLVLYEGVQLVEAQVDAGVAPRSQSLEEAARGGSGGERGGVNELVADVESARACGQTRLALEAQQRAEVSRQTAIEFGASVV